MATTTSSESKNRLNFSLDPRIIILLLLAVIVAMLAMWRPWSASGSDRTVVVTGETTVTAVPDEFVFYPSYEFENADKAAALAALSSKSEEVIAKLRELGVAEAKIKSNSSGYDYPKYPEDTDRDTTYSLQLTIEVGDKDLAQKVQDYLVTTTPTGAVSPQASFSDEKRRELESEARDEATKDARIKADQMATNLGFKVGKVKTVSDGSGFGVMPYGPEMAISSDSARSTLSVQPGENEINYTVTVTYYVR